MKFKVQGEIADVTRGLTLRPIWPALTMAEIAVDTAASDLAAAKQRALDAAVSVDQVRRDMAAGITTTAQLQHAMDEQKRAAVSIASFERRVQTAKVAVIDAHTAARVAFRAEALRRHDALAKIAAQLSPVLDALRDAELAIDQALQTETAHTDRYGISRSEPPTPGLDWPCSLMADASARSIGMAIQENR